MMADNKPLNEQATNRTASIQGTDDAAAAIKRGATDLAQNAKQTAVGVANDAQDKLREVASDAQQTLTNVAEQAKQDAGAVVEDQKNMLADRLRTVSDSLRQTGSRLNNGDEAMIGGYAQDAAGQIDRFAGYLQNHDVGDLINEVRDLAHRQPEIFVAGSLAVGFLLGRFLKSSDAFPGRPVRSIDDERSRGYPDRSYRRTYLGEGYRRADYGPGEYSAGSMPSSNRGDTTYADLQYRDAMRGDERFREEELRSRNAGYSSGARAAGSSYGVQENAAGRPAHLNDPARQADRSTSDRSTTGPGFSPADYGNTGYRGSANLTANEAQSVAAQDSGKRNNAQNQDASARGAQSS